MILTTFLIGSTILHWTLHGNKKVEAYKNEYNFIIVGLTTVCVAFLSRFSLHFIQLDGLSDKRDIAAPHILKLWKPPSEFKEQFNCKDGVCSLVKKELNLNERNLDTSESPSLLNTLSDSEIVNAYHCTMNMKNTVTSSASTVHSENPSESGDFVASLFDSFREASKAFGVDTGKMEDETQWKIVVFIGIHLTSYGVFQAGTI